jgi:hypothetical protein
MESGKPYEVTGRIFLPSGTVLATNDVLLGVPVGENQVVEKVDLLVLGDTDIAAGSVGYFQILDRDGNAAVVQHNGPLADSDTKFTSPATDDDHYHAAMQLDGFVEMVQSAPEKLGGPVNVGIKVTTGATVGADTEVFIGVRVRGETSQSFLPGTSDTLNGDNDYLIGA